MRLQPDALCTQPGRWPRRLRIVKKLTWQPACDLAPIFWTFAFKSVYMPM